MLAKRLLEMPTIQRSNAMRTFVTAAWLGWQIESNWTDPFLFAIYSIARPLSSIAILVVMYNVITDGAMDDPLFAFIYLGNALYILVAQVMTGVSWSIIDDREHYRTMKQLHTAPMNSYFYLLGRGVARFTIACIALVITLSAGVLFFKLPLTLSEINFPLLVVTFIAGIITIACMGLTLGAFTLFAGRHAFSLGDAFSGAMFLFTGAIFPLDVLPGWMQPIGYVFPPTYWLELMRRGILGDQMARFETFNSFTTNELLIIVLSLMVVMAVASHKFYAWALNRARYLGVIDEQTNY